MNHQSMQVQLLALALLASVPSAARAQRMPQTDEALAAYADSAWPALIRFRIAGNSGVNWTLGGWEMNADWAGQDEAAKTAYALEPDLRGALALAAVTRNVPRLEDIAGFYLAFAGRFRPLSEVVSRATQVGGHSSLSPQGSPDALVLPWVDHQPGNKNWPSECSLCTSQAMHPAARLLHLLALLPAAQRTPVMIRFGTTYTPLLARDVVIRFVYQTHWMYNKPNNQPFVLADQWTKELAGSGGAKYRMLDRDLWLLGIAAEVLAAHHEAPVLAPLVSNDSAQLAAFVRLGVRMVAARQNPHPLPTAGAPGPPVIGSLLFKGEFDSDPDMAFAATTSTTYPDPAQAVAPHDGGWDMSHSQRIPTVLRSLWDARSALGLTFPDSAALAQVTNQYYFVVYQPGLPGPLFHNFFNGGDGWYRVGFNGNGDFTYAPSAICQNSDPTRYCLSRGAASGWQLLRFAKPELREIAERLFALAADTTEQGQAFRHRVWETSDDQFVWTGARLKYSQLLARLIGEYLLGAHAELPR